MNIQQFIFLIFSLLIFDAKGADPFTIKLNNSSPVQYCTESIFIAKDLTIEGIPNILGMKISFSEGYIPGEDELVYIGKLKQSQPTPGTLELTGGVSVQEYVDAIRTITYHNTNNRPSPNFRKITISLNDVDYLPATGHFYRYVSASLISWQGAKADAESNAMMYYGLRGYLATITSQVENDFIKIKTKGVGWIGASDARIEGEWRWVTGPEALEDNGTGRLFWNGKGASYLMGVPGTGPYLGRFNNWNTNEPNDSGNNEDYAHILFSSGQSTAQLRWNDLPNTGGNGLNDTPQGYLIEFGGYSDDPILNLSATVDLQVNTMLFNASAISAICEGTSIVLNQPEQSPVAATYIWTPAGSLSNASIANPVATPLVTTTYAVNGLRGICSNTASFTVPVNPKPVSLLKAEENICKGDKITLDPGNYPLYSWNGGAATRTITVETSGQYSVTATTDKGCTGTSVSKVIVHDYPVIDLAQLEKLSCGGSKATLLTITTNAAGYSLESVGNRATVSGLAVVVRDFGIYPMVYTAIHTYCPVKTNFDLAFNKTPTVNFTIDDKTCSGYNLSVSYVGDASIASAGFIWEFGGDTIANETGLSSLVVPLGINRSQRNLALTVTQDGCSNSFIQRDIKVIPNLDMHIIDNLGCAPFNAEFIAENTEVVVYDWDFGDGTPIARKDNHPFHNYQNAGYYDVKLKVTTVVASGQGCTNEVRIDSIVHVAPIPTAGFTLSAGDCLNPGLNEISYSGSGNINDKYYWDLTHFDPSEIITNPLLTQGPLGFDLKTQPTATVGLKVISEFGCESAPATILLKRKPDFLMHSDALAGCVPFEPQLSAAILDAVDNIFFSWDFGDGSNGAGSPVSHRFGQSDQKYNITLTGKSSVTGCTNTLTNNNFLRTYPKPVAAFTMDNKVVYNDKPDVKFTDTSKGATGWLWNFGDGTTSSLQNLSYHFVKMGHQKIMLEVSNTDLCTDTVSQNLLVAFDRLFPPNGFSPNARNETDRIFLLTSEGITPQGYHFTILSRWNDVLFEAKEEIKGWDGRMKNGGLAPAGAYVWILNFTDFLGRKHRQTGALMLVY
ncbi:MAG: PKD domain-containing protein [Mariniphaga sp.]